MHKAEARSGPCPVAGLGNIYKPYQHDGMYELFRRARVEEPVFYSEELGFWVVTKREDVEPVFRDTKRFSAVVASAAVHPFPDDVLSYMRAAGYTLEPVHVNLDGQPHAHIRAIAARFLNIKRLSSYEDQIRRLARDHIEKIKGAGRVDIVETLTYELPAQVVFLLLGESNVNTAKIKSWADKRLMTIFGKLGHDELMEASRELVDFWNYAKGIVADRERNPKDDYPSMLLEIRGGDDAVLTRNQVESLVFALLLAGHETTTNALGNLILELLSNRDQWERLVSDPSLIGAAVEEGLRFASSVVTWRRRALEDVEIGGITIPAGSTVLLALGSANRDEAHFVEGETFDITRRNARDHLSFGKGIHMCLGAPLARLEMRVVIEELVKAFPDMRLVRDQRIDWIPTITFRGPVSLEVELAA